MKRILREQLMTVFKIFVIVMVVGLLGATFAISKVSAAASSPIKVQYDKITRHNLMIGVGKTTGNYLTFSLTGKGTINSATWSSSNTSVLAVVSKTGSKGTAKCKIKGVKEGHAVLKLTVKTTKNKKNYTYTEYVGVSVFTDIKDMYCVSYAIPETYIYRGATTEQFESVPGIGAEYRNKAFFKILYQCGDYYYVNLECEAIWYKGEIIGTNTSFVDKEGATEGFVKKGHVLTSVPALVHGVEISETYDNYPLNSETQFYAHTIPCDISVSYKWSSSNPKVATVSSTGYVKAVGPGEATITASYGKYEAKKNIRVSGLVVYDALSKNNIVNDSLEAIKSELGKPFSYSNLLPTDDIPYDVAFNIERDSCALCNTQNRYFESLDMFNTNCYGFVINHWSFIRKSSVANGKERFGTSCTPGVISGTYDKYMVDRPSNLAQLVKNDIEYMGGDAQILEGSDNTPNYPTDENHYLIAIRTHGAYDRADYDFHFMIKKSGEWYFKDGVGGDILKIKNNNNPSQIFWNARYCVHDGRYHATDFDFYTAPVQYMVISKLPIRITVR